MIRIVVWDPSGQYPEGSFVEGDRGVEKMIREGVMLLPADPELMQQSPIAGFFSRKWGPGWAYTGARAVRGCPMLMYLPTEVVRVNWIARLAPDPEEVTRSGILRMVGHTSAPGQVAGGLSAISTAINLAELPDPDEHGGWTVHGESKLAMAQEGFVGVALHGACTGVRILISAVSAVRG